MMSMNMMYSNDPGQDSCRFELTYDHVHNNVLRAKWAVCEMHRRLV